MLLTAHLGDEALVRRLEQTHNIELQGEERKIARYWDISEGAMFEFLATRLSQQVRLGLTVLDEMSFKNQEVISRLRELGFDVDVFMQDSVLNG